MRKKYDDLLLEILRFNEEDIVRTSTAKDFYDWIDKISSDDSTFEE